MQAVSKAVPRWTLELERTPSEARVDRMIDAGQVKIE